MPILFCGLLSCFPATAAPARIFFDTDMETDCDDCGALAILHSLADRGECEILATVVSTKDVHSLGTVDAINRYYGRPFLPWGLVKGEGVLLPSKFAAAISAEFPHRELSTSPDALDTYRRVLSQQPDHSVNLVTVGYLTNLRKLMQQEARGDSPSGLDLLQAKVRVWICMGGNFIGDPPKDDLTLGNVNFQRDAESALYVIEHWPGEVIFMGREVASVPSGLTVGQHLAQTPPQNPVRRGYELYFDGAARNRHVADLATVLFAVRGRADYWDLSEPGQMELRHNMTFAWHFDPSGHQRYVRKKGGNDRAVEEVLDGLLTAGPRRTSTR